MKLDKEVYLMKTKQELINEIYQLHKEQRKWQILVHDEKLDFEKLNSMTCEQLEKALESVKK